MIQLVANQVEMTTLLDFNTAKHIELLKKQVKLLTSCSQFKLLADQVNTARAMIAVKNQGTQMIQLVANQAEVTRLLDFKDTAKQIELSKIK
jgi:hypothetical protein